MDDRLKESVSALMDDEVNELELQRILSHTDKLELTDTWKRYHMVRDVLNTEYEEQLEVDVLQGVLQGIDLHENATSKVDHQEGKVEFSSTASLSSRAGGFLAIAASVAFAFVFVLQNGVQSDLGGAPSVAASQSSVLNESSLVKVSNVDAVQRQPKINVDFSAEHAKRFNTYLLRHSEHSVLGLKSGAMPLARVASVNSVGI